MSNGAKEPAELTVKAVGLGIFLSFVFGAANAYLGMRAGQTVAATIPAAVIAMALFRLPAFKGTIYEQNIARTAASVGEALVAGAIFTIPAFMLVDIDGVRLWTDLRSHFWEATMILLAGGLIGVFFIILLRRPLCVDAGLPWPESVACVELVKAGGGEGAGASKLIFGSMGIGALVQFAKSDKGLHVLTEYVEGFWAFPKSVIRHFDFDKKIIGSVTHGGGIPWATPALSPALMGVGYLIGPELASINVAGGIIAWWLLIPLLLFFDPDLPRRLGGDSVGVDVQAYTLWYNVVRPIAVGTMLVAATNTMVQMRSSIYSSLKGAFAASAKAAEGGAAVVERTERDIPAKWVLLATAILIVPITIMYFYFTQSWKAAIVAGLLMTITGFLLSAVGGYLVGLVGSSNQPVSGLTLAALVLSALLLLSVGVTGKAGVGAVLGVASVVCCAICVSGSLIQDLKAGHLLGGTPWKMQVVEILAVVLLSFFLIAPIVALHEANLDTGGIGGRALPAPQAGLMAQLSVGIMGGQMAWGLLGIGAAFGVALLLCGARAPMLIAVGMYLPFDTSSAIFVGGAMKWLADRIAAKRGEAALKATEDRGTLMASGLIAGEAVVGILLATAFLAGVPSMAIEALAPFRGWFTLAVFAALGWMLVQRVQARHSN
ncbi:MAG: oligopeptide transporter, OPT family [Acidobacteriota bacterium]